MKINVCFFVGSFQTGGAENHVLRILENIDRDKYNPHVCVFIKAGQFFKDFEKLNVPITEFKFRRYNIPGFIFHQIRFVRFLIKARIHLVHVHLGGCFRFALTGALLAGIPYKIITWHNIYPRSRLSFIRPVVFANRFSDKIIAVSEKVKELNCESYGVNRHKVEVIYNGIDPAPFENSNQGGSSSRRSKDKSDLFSIGVVGALLEQKGHKFLLEAMAKLRDTVPGIQLLVVGDGPLKRALLEQVERKDIHEHVKFLGVRNDVPDLLKRFDLWVMPSLYEGFSIALLEAMASGLPIIATDVGGNSEAIIDKESGLLIPSENVKAIVESVEYLYAHPKEKERLAENARKRFEANFTITKMMEHLDFMYSAKSSTKRNALLLKRSFSVANS